MVIHSHRIVLINQHYLQIEYQAITINVFRMELSIIPFLGRNKIRLKNKTKHTSSESRKQKVSLM